jgi:hypothetical protein
MSGRQTLFAGYMARRSAHCASKTGAEQARIDTESAEV